MDEGNVELVRKRAAFRADDAGSDRVGEAERRAECRHPVSRLEPRRAAEPRGRQAARLDLEQRYIAALVRADHRRAELTLRVGEPDSDVVGVCHEVRVGEDVAVLTDDEAGAETFAARRSVAAGRSARDRKSTR